MAGVMMTGDEGKEVNKVEVPTIGGIDGVPGTNPIVETDHLHDGGTPPSYPAESMTSLDGGAYPMGSVMSDATPGDDVN